MWTVRNTVEDKWTRFKRKHPETIEEITDTIDFIIIALENGISLREIDDEKRELRCEKDGLYRISQTSNQIKAGRAYVYFEAIGEDIVILDITNKPNKKKQNEDIKRARKRKREDEQRL